MVAHATTSPSAPAKRSLYDASPTPTIRMLLGPRTTSFPRRPSPGTDLSAIPATNLDTSNPNLPSSRKPLSGVEVLSPTSATAAPLTATTDRRQTHGSRIHLGQCALAVRVPRAFISMTALNSGGWSPAASLDAATQPTGRCNYVIRTYCDSDGCDCAGPRCQPDVAVECKDDGTAVAAGRGMKHAVQMQAAGTGRRSLCE